MGSFPFLDFSSFESSDAEASKCAATELVAFCHEYGLVAVSDHGLSDQTFSRLSRSPRNSLLYHTKRRCKRHTLRHRNPTVGSLALGSRKYIKNGQSTRAMRLWFARSKTTSLRRRCIQSRRSLLMNVQESYEIGSETNRIEPNIWIPDETLPIFRPFMLNFYAELDQLASRFMRAFMIGLDLNMGPEQEAFLQLNSHDQNQLRLLYYPAVGHDELGKAVLSRLPTHTDISSFTMTFQDSSGLEFQNPTTGLFSPAAETKNILLLNVGTILQRLTNDYFIAAEYHVTVPSHGQGLETGLQARYSIPYFVNPRHDYRIQTLDRFVSPSNSARYESIRYDEYSARITKFQYVPPCE